MKIDLLYLYSKGLVSNHLVSPGHKQSEDFFHLNDHCIPRVTFKSLFKAVMDEYFQSGHAEPVPEADLENPPHRIFYLPIHMVRKESSMTTKVRAVFDA